MAAGNYRKSRRWLMVWISEWFGRGWRKTNRHGQHWLSNWIIVLFLYAGLSKLPRAVISFSFGCYFFALWWTWVLRVRDVERKVQQLNVSDGSRTRCLLLLPEWQCAFRRPLAVDRWNDHVPFKSFILLRFCVTSGCRKDNNTAKVRQCDGYNSFDLRIGKHKRVMNATT